MCPAFAVCRSGSLHAQREQWSGVPWRPSCPAFSFINPHMLLHAVYRLAGIKAPNGSSTAAVSFSAPAQIVIHEPTTCSGAAEQLHAAGLQLPLLAKSLHTNSAADDSHCIGVLHSMEALGQVLSMPGVAGLALPLVLQQYVPHGPQLYKVRMCPQSGQEDGGVHAALVLARMHAALPYAVACIITPHCLRHFKQRACAAQMLPGAVS